MRLWKILVLLVFVSIQCSAQNIPDNNLANHKLSGIIQWKYEKRPFCNAFTGCGKKRAVPYPLMKRNDEQESRTYNVNNDDITEELSDLIDINAEPAVENVQKQIMSQAKIFEAIKEASKEIFRQKNRQRYFDAKQQQEKQAQQLELMDSQPNQKFEETV